MTTQTHKDTFSVVTEYLIVNKEHTIPSIHFEIDGNANLDDLVKALEQFVRALGYVIDQDKHLEFVYSEED